MTIYCVQTLVDITENGPLNRTFPFKGKSGNLIHDKSSLHIAKSQEQNFNTLVQTLQLRANITWESHPLESDVIVNNTNFGTAYEGKHKSWAFVFFTEQDDIYGDVKSPGGTLENDLDLVPIINFCKETATFPINAFITQHDKTRNTFVSRIDDTQHVTAQREDLKSLIDTYINR